MPPKGVKKTFKLKDGCATPAIASDVNKDVLTDYFADIDVVTQCLVFKDIRTSMPIGLECKEGKGGIMDTFDITKYSEFMAKSGQYKAGGNLFWCLGCLPQ